MFLRHWGLHEDPFSTCSPGNPFLAGMSHDEALARLDYLVDQTRAFGFMVGEAGVGKTCLLDVFARRRKRRGESVTSINLARTDTREFLWTFSAGLGLNPPEEANTFRLWRQVSDRLSERRYQQLRTVLIGDDAQFASDEILGALSQLLQLAGGESRLTLILAARHPGQRRVEAALGDVIDLRIEVEPWEEAETAEFVRLRLAGAGVSRAVFEPRALTRLHVLSRGVPRLVRRLAEMSLAAGAATQRPLVDERTVESVFSEVVLSPPAFSESSLPSVGGLLDNSRTDFQTVVSR